MINTRNPYHLQSKEERRETWHYYRSLCHTIVCSTEKKKLERLEKVASDIYNSHITHITAEDIKPAK